MRAVPNKRRRSRRRRRGSLGPVLRVLSVVLAAVAIVAALTLFFKVDQVLVTGNTRYTAGEIVAVTQVEQGDNLILLDKYGIAQRLYTELPYIKEVRINRKLPDMLLVEVTETKAVASIQGGGGYWLLSGSGKILESADSASAKEYLQLEGMTAEEAAVSAPLKLAEDSCLSRERLLELLEALESRGMLTRADGVDAGDRDKLVLRYDGRFRVELPYDADFGYKLDCLLAAVSQLQPNESGTILMNLQNENEARFISGS